MNTLLKLLQTLFQDLLGVSAPGIPVTLLAPGEAASPFPDMKADGVPRTLPKQEAQLTFELLDAAGEPVGDGIALDLARDTDATDLILKVYLSMRTGRPGYAAGEVVKMVVDHLEAKGYALGETYTVAAQAEKVAYLGCHKPTAPEQKSIDVFAISFAVVLAEVTPADEAKRK